MTNGSDTTHVLEIRRWTGEPQALDAAADLYAEVFSETPYDENPDQSRKSFLSRVEKYGRTKPHFRLILAWQQDALVGIALGNGITTGDWWRDRVIPQLPIVQSDEWFGEEAFAVVELAVSPAHRRGGIAASLLATLVAGLPYPTAVLSAYAAAETARRFYRRQGWTEVASELRLGESPELCLLGMHLPGDSSQQR